MNTWCLNYSFPQFMFYWWVAYIFIVCTSLIFIYIRHVVRRVQNIIVRDIPDQITLAILWPLTIIVFSYVLLEKIDKLVLSAATKFQQYCKPREFPQHRYKVWLAVDFGTRALAHEYGYEYNNGLHQGDLFPLYKRGKYLYIYKVTGVTLDVGDDRAIWDDRLLYDFEYLERKRVQKPADAEVK